MKCEICHEADAAAVIHVKKDGEERELYVCKACAAKSRHKKMDPKPRDEGAPALDFGEGEEPPEFVKNLVEATLGFMKGVVESEQNARTCPACKTTWEQAKESGHLGCPNCWKAFAKNLMTHVNPYTGRAYKDEPALPLISLINEGGLFMGWGRPCRGTPF